MALDRTWYNTLVDDSGSGLDGSIWDKGDVNSLMNAIDAEIARIDLVDSCHVTTLSTQTAVAPNIAAAIIFDTAVWQSTAGMFVPPRDYIAVPRTGYYLVTGIITYPVGAGVYTLCIYMNGGPAPGLAGQHILAAGTTQTYTVIQVSAIVNAPAGALIQLVVYQNTAAGIWMPPLNPLTTNSMQVHRLK